jgi:hypothetical protein
MIENIIVGVASSLTASAIFLFFLYSLRPNIAVSPYIAKEVGADGKAEYGFKFINHTPYPLTEIRARIRLRVAEVAPGGTSNAGVIWSSKKLAETEIWQVPRYDENDRDYQYAQRTALSVDLETLWQDSQISELVFEIAAKHSLSGFSTVTTRSWKKKADAIRNGKHNYGNDLGVS